MKDNTIMKEVFVKKYWGEEGIMFYLHFKDEMAVRQIEVSQTGTKYLSTAEPIDGESALYDQTLDQLSIDDEDLISKDDFELMWKQGGNQKNE